MHEPVPQFSPSSAMADFEEATVSAFRRVFRDVTVIGWFYFVQSGRAVTATTRVHRRRIVERPLDIGVSCEISRAFLLP